MKYYLGPIAWMGIIFVFSTDVGSMNNTNSIFIPIIKFFAPEIPRRELVMTLIAIRKVGHVVEYAILSVLWFYALKQGKGGRSWRPVLGALAISLIYAALDEFHQSFIHSRTASIQDVGLNSAGALLGQGLWGGVFRSKIFSSVKIKFFAWWFAWGVFSTMMALIVFKGAHLSFWTMILLIVLIGLLAGMIGVLYSVRRH